MGITEISPNNCQNVGEFWQNFFENDFNLFDYKKRITEINFYSPDQKNKKILKIHFEKTSENLIGKENDFLKVRITDEYKNKIEKERLKLDVETRRIPRINFVKIKYENLSKIKYSTEE